MTAPKKKQTKEDRQYILDNLPQGTRRVQVINAQGNQEYKRPEDVDALADHYRIVTWDYRGLFESEIPSDRRRLGDQCTSDRRRWFLCSCSHEW